uniref:Tensin-4-like n=1 Tax=Callorhinchus milii TaxID=7868 RepID=A0A4W3HLJ4_CALMI|eukprot:gi/632966812/ref/XP_007899627.1/ PREDICTED: tensin-4-like [Callorhinchus milii]
MSVHTLHLEQSPGSRAGHWPESMVLNGSSMNRAFTNVVYPGSVTVSQTNAYSQRPAERWVCRQVTMSPPASNLGYQPYHPSNPHQTLSVKSAYGQKPPSPCPHTVLQRAAGDYHRTPQEPEQTEAWNFFRKGSDADQNPGDQASSPSLDATIENLNNLILELDPTFQPINTGVRGAWDSLRHDTSSSSVTALPHCHTHKEEFPGDSDGTGILLYNEWDSPGRRDEQQSVSLISHGGDRVDSPERGDIGSPNSDSHHRTFTLPGYSQARDGWSGPTSLSRDISHPVIVSKPHIPIPTSSSSMESRYIDMSPCPSALTSRGPSTHSTSHQSRGLCISPSDSLSTSPQRNTLPILVPTPHGSLLRDPACNYLSMSPVSESIHKCSLARPSMHVGSTGSLLSTSPGSDVLGSSHSLLSEDGRMYRSTGSTYGSSGSFVNMSSPFGTSPGTCKISFSDQRLHEASPQARGAGRSFSHHGASNTGPGRRQMTSQHNAARPQYISSCPASTTTSFTDIPLLLINGAPEHGQSHSHKKPPPSPGYFPEANANCTARRPPGLNVGSIGSFKASSLVSLEDQCDSQPSIKFVQDTSKYWYKPNLSREQAIEILKDKEPGSFIVRESSTYVGSYGLAMKVSSPSSSPGSPPDNRADSPSQQVRHFLIEFSRKGVSLKGSAQEPFFGSLSALVYQHCITPMALPCKLILPRKESSSEENSPDSSERTASPLLKNGAVFNILYLNSVTMETLTGPQAILKATSLSLEREPMPPATVVQFRVSEQGITLTDSKRRLFFRRHYTAGTVNHCGLDPLQRKWRKDNEPSRIFGFVAKSQSNATENICHLFAEYQHEQPASTIINSVTSILPGLQRE